MRLDKFNNPIFNDSDIFDAMYHGHLAALPSLMVDTSDDILELQKIAEFSFLQPCDEARSIQEFDKTQQSQWFMPSAYYSFNIEEFCLSKCKNQDEIDRVNEELAAYKEHGMDTLLKWLKYFVDTCIENNVFWGVGRGSSVSSYVLYLIGVHRINSIKYKLDWKEFLR